MAVKWLDEPEAHDFDAAAAFLSMLAEADAESKVVDALRAAAHEERAAKDILRAAALPLLPSNYHRVCASYLTDENTVIPCRLVSWPS